MVNATKRGPKQLREIVLDTANVNGISTEFLEKSIQRLINILGTPAATYKDRIFRMLVKEKKIALEIYNAINDTHYDNPEDVIITTLENAVYLGMKNDVSLELKVKVLNVNRGYNDCLMKKSPTLYQYMMFVDTVRRFQKEYPFEQAM